LDAGIDRFAADARNARGAVRVVGKRVLHVVRQLTVNADRLNAVEDGVAGSL